MSPRRDASLDASGAGLSRRLDASRVCGSEAAEDLRAESRGAESAWPRGEDGIVSATVDAAAAGSENARAELAWPIDVEGIFAAGNCAAEAEDGTSGAGADAAAAAGSENAPADRCGADLARPRGVEGIVAAENGAAEADVGKDADAAAAAENTSANTSADPCGTERV